MSDLLKIVFIVIRCTILFLLLLKFAWDFIDKRIDLWYNNLCELTNRIYEYNVRHPDSRIDYKVISLDIKTKDFIRFIFTRKMPKVMEDKYYEILERNS